MISPAAATTWVKLFADKPEGWVPDRDTILAQAEVLTCLIAQSGIPNMAGNMSAAIERMMELLVEIQTVSIEAYIARNGGRN